MPIKTSSRSLVEQARATVQALDLAGLKKRGFLPLSDMFVPVIMYPPLTMFPKTTGDALFDGLEWKGHQRNVLYVHIPQCATHCTFCHWVTTLSNSSSDIDAYLDHLEKEMDLWLAKLGGARVSPASVLIGGGTPTILSPKQLERLLKALASRFDLSRCRQISIEAEPSTLLGRIGLERLRVMKAFGVDRVSMGVQSFDDDVLKFMARFHDAGEAREAIRQMRKAGIPSIAIDLVYGFPGSSLEKWAHTLETALAADIDMFQLYRLRILPHGDASGAIKDIHEQTPKLFPSLEETYVMKALGMESARRQGFKEDLRDFFCRDPRHISLYQRDQLQELYDTVALGISSRSVLGGRYGVNMGPSLKHYYAAIDAGRLPVDRGFALSPDDLKRRAVAGPIKHGGVSKANFLAATGATLVEAYGAGIRRLKENGLLVEDEDRLMLTERGGFFADEVALQFFDPKNLPIPRSDYADGEMNPYPGAGG